MRRTEINKSVDTSETPQENTQIEYIVDGCTVLLHFPTESNTALINDIKRMMLSAAVKV